uniref:Uncharacterized protein n=1 Tax=Hanusia phi TaxID=3032 RepID=A0A7S0EC97_9CRYP|mmetsp:Transcript_21502/g.48710  ORF Transcript_21502/g.48710 Transcript_21502/m.48710 type:complete len:259 (+) Transcript_21502:120-896(+)
MKTEEEKLQARLDRSRARLQKLRCSRRDALDHMISNPPISHEVKKSLVRSSRSNLEEQKQILYHELKQANLDNEKRDMEIVRWALQDDKASSKLVGPSGRKKLLRMRRDLHTRFLNSELERAMEELNLDEKKLYRQELKNYLENRNVQKLRRESMVSRNQLQKLLAQTPGRKHKPAPLNFNGSFKSDVLKSPSVKARSVASSEFSHRFLSDNLADPSGKPIAISPQSSTSTLPSHRGTTYEIIADGAGNAHVGRRRLD